jgi:vitamin B12 transporter
MKLFFIPFACLWAEAVFAQQSDTVYLREISVFGLPVTEYATGSKVETLRITDPLSTLAGGLNGEASIYLKNYGNQQLSSIALRGTTASQTAVVWNGININSPTLGQTDFSLIPLFLFDEVSLHYGTATSFYGSDAIGGSVVVGHSTAEFKKAFSGTLHQQVGSFGKSVSGVKFSYGNERWQFRTKAYRAFIQNDFSYKSPAVRYRKKQDHASVVNYSFDQQVHYKIASDKILWGEIMYTDNDREVQPTVTGNDADELLSNKNLRAAINYRHDSRWGIIHATSAWQFSDQDFTADLPTTVQSTQFTAQVNIDRPITSRSNLRYGLSYNYYTATAENFHDVGEGRYDVFASWRYAILPHWIVNLNVTAIHLRPALRTIFTHTRFGVFSHQRNKSKNKFSFTGSTRLSEYPRSMTGTGIPEEIPPPNRKMRYM